MGTKVLMREFLDTHGLSSVAVETSSEINKSVEKGRDSYNYSATTISITNGYEIISFEYYLNNSSKEDIENAYERSLTSLKKLQEAVDQATMSVNEAYIKLSARIRTAEAAESFEQSEDVSE